MTHDDMMDQFKMKVLENISEYGWHCNHVLADAETVGFSYTVGLYATYGHPELIIFGLPHTISHPILITAADAAKSKAPLDLTKPNDKLIVDYSCIFAEVPASQYAEHVGVARWYYQGKHFPLYQIIWPSRNGLFPWHPNSAAQFRASQPIIADLPIA